VKSEEFGEKRVLRCEFKDKVRGTRYKIQE